MSKGTVNKVIIVGRLGKDPDLRYSPSGTAIASFSVATNHSFKNEGGDWSDKTEWHNVVTFARSAEFAGEYLKKGRLVYIEGRLQTSSWEDQQGQKRYKTEIIALTLQSLGSKGDNSGVAAAPAAPKTSAAAPAAETPPPPPPPPAAEGEDDLPF
jgi:single-strand DNA-binding protein